MRVYDDYSLKANPPALPVSLSYELLGKTESLTREKAHLHAQHIPKSSNTATQTDSSDNQQPIKGANTHSPYLCTCPDFLWPASENVHFEKQKYILGPENIIYFYSQVQGFWVHFYLILWEMFEVVQSNSGDGV